MGNSRILFGNNEVRAELKLKNGRTFMTEQIRCPICAAPMEMSKSTITLPKDELRLRDRTPPFCGTVCECVETYDSVMSCPNNCCTLNFEHEVVSVVH